METRLRFYLLTMCCGFTPALAAPIAVPNLSFEEPDVGDGTSTGSVPGWTVSSGGGGFVSVGLHDQLNGQYLGATGNSTPLPGAASGFQNAFITLQPAAMTSFARLNTGPLGVVTVNTTYVLTVALGNPLDADPANVTYALTSDGDAFAGTALRGDWLSLIPNGTFVDFQFTFTLLPGDSNIGGALGIELMMHAPSGSPQVQANFDNVRLTSTEVPEPSSAWVIAAAWVAMVRRSRR